MYDPTRKKVWRKPKRRNPWSLWTESPSEGRHWMECGHCQKRYHGKEDHMFCPRCGSQLHLKHDVELVGQWLNEVISKTKIVCAS